MHEQSADHWMDSTISGGMYHVLAKGRTGTFGARYNGRSDLGEHVFIWVPPLGLLDSLELRAKFVDYARELGRISFQCVTGITDFGFQDEIPFLVMQQPLGVAISGIQSRNVDGLFSWLPCIAQKLDELHSQGFRHYDVCPETIWIEQSERIRLSDFGVGHAVQSVLTEKKTQNKMLCPTRYYAPELIPVDPYDGRCDQFSLAMTARWWLDSKGIDLPSYATMDEVLQLATASDPSDRYSSCNEFVVALQDAVSQRGKISVPLASEGHPFPELDEFTCPGCGTLIARHELGENQTGRCPQDDCGLLLGLDDSTRQLTEQKFHCSDCGAEISSKVFTEGSRSPCPDPECAVLLEVPESGNELREVLLQCPKCKNKFSRGRFKQDKSITCLSCPQILTLDASGLRAVELPPEISVIIDPIASIPCPHCAKPIFREALRGVTQAECSSCGKLIAVTSEGVWVPIKEKTEGKRWGKRITVFVFIVILVAIGLYLARSTTFGRWAYDSSTELFLDADKSSTSMETVAGVLDSSNSKVVKAQQFMESGDDEQAMEYLQRALEQNPEDTTALKLKAEIELARGRREEAITTLTSAIRLNINDADAYLRRARVFFAEKKYSRVVSDCSDALRANPDWKEAYVLRSKAYEKIGNTTRAERDRKKADSIRNDGGDR